jgi:hypothetical protein
MFYHTTNVNITADALAICKGFQCAVHFCSKINEKLLDCAVNCLKTMHIM